jgi:hypothetical protein
MANTSAMGQRLLAARQQVDGRVLLARRLGHHLHAGVQDLVAGHDQLGRAAAEQAGEHAAEALVDLVEGAHQQVAGLQVDLVDRVFQRGDGVGQVGGLGVQEGLALARGGQLVQRGQVDGAQAGDLAVDAVDLALQAVSDLPPRWRGPGPPGPPRRRSAAPVLLATSARRPAAPAAAW